MKKIALRIFHIIIGFCTLVVLGLTWFISREYKKLESDDPKVWQSVISGFTENTPNHCDCILFIGDSNIRFWGSLEEDMVPLKVLKRGFGGAKINDIIFFADKIIFPYKPNKIVLFAGINDISGRENDKTPRQLARDFMRLDAMIQDHLPNTQVLYLPIIPTQARWDVWHLADEANHLIREYASAKPHITFIDTTSKFLDSKGNIRKELLWWDGLHLSKKGYEIWTALLRQELLMDL